MGEAVQSISSSETLQKELSRTGVFRAISDDPIAVDRIASAERVLIYFAAYRAVLACTLCLAYWKFNDLFTLGLVLPKIATPSFLIYLVGSGVLFVLAIFRMPALVGQLRLQFGFDVIMLALLTCSSGGTRSGIAILILISVACAALCARGRFAIGYAAAAALMLLVQQVYLSLAMEWPISDFSGAGLTCMAYFAVSIVARGLAGYADVSEKIAEARGLDVANLAQINELVLQEIPDAVMVVDERGVIRQKNARTIEWLGPIPPEARGRLGDYCPPLASRLQAWRVAPTSINALNADVTLPDVNSLAMDGRDVSVRFVEIGSTALPTTVIFLEDLARTKQAAQQIKLASLGRLTASIAHEIRNPLSSIAHATELLQEDTNRNPADVRMLKIVHDNAQRIDRLIEEVLYLNRRDRAKPEFINASIYLEEFVDNFCQVEAVSKDLIGIECELTETLQFDRTHLDQIVWNLLRNAVRYCSKKPGAILLYCRTMPQAVQLGVIDDGSGVSAKDLNHLFEPFFTTDAQGTGIGLYMARELSEANGAQLEYVPTALTSGAHFRLSRLF